MLNIQRENFKGYISNKTDFFKQIKQDQRNRNNRFQNLGAKRTSFNDKKEKEQGVVSLLSDTQASSHDSVSLEMSDMNKNLNTLPPEWADYYYSTQQLLEEFNNLFKEITKLSSDRVKITFGNTKELDTKIGEKTAKATANIRKCENNISQIDRAASMLYESDVQAKLRENIKKSMAIQIQEATMQLRKQQKGLFQQLTKFDQDSKNVPEQVKAPWNPQQDEEQDNDIIVEYCNQRNEDINKLVETMNELAVIFKQLNNLVIDQGTVLDRIDFNMDNTEKQVKQAVKHLDNAKKLQESPCAKRTIQLLSALIVFFSIVLIIKYTN